MVLIAEIKNDVRVKPLDCKFVRKLCCCGLGQTLIKGNALLSPWDINSVTSNADNHSAPLSLLSQNSFLKRKLYLFFLFIQAH